MLVSALEKLQGTREDATIQDTVHYFMSLQFPLSLRAQAFTPMHTFIVKEAGLDASSSSAPSSSAKRARLADGST
jgi:hypothetical protein